MLKAFLRSLCLPVALALAASTFAVAQDSTPVLRDQTKNQNDDQSMETLKVRVNVVQLFFNVKDKKGALIPNQTRMCWTCWKMASLRPSNISRQKPICRLRWGFSSTPAAARRACSKWRRKWAARFS